MSRLLVFKYLFQTLPHIKTYFRAVHLAFNGRNETIPGKFDGKNCYISYDYKEFKKTEFEVLLSSDDYKWVPESNGDVPENAVIGGEGVNIDGTDYSEKFFIGRALHEGIYIPGKIHPSHECFYYPFDGKEFKVTNYEVLVKDIKENEAVIHLQETIDPDILNPPEQKEITNDVEDALTLQEISDPGISTPPEQKELTNDIEDALTLQETIDPDISTPPEQKEITTDEAALITLQDISITERKVKSGKISKDSSKEGFDELLTKGKENFESMKKDEKILKYKIEVKNMEFGDNHMIQQMNSSFSNTEKAMIASFKTADSTKQEIFFRGENQNKFLSIKFEKEEETGDLVDEFIEKSFKNGHSGKH